ncbi:sensor histidine kinase [Actinomadura napierensis]
MTPAAGPGIEPSPGPQPVHRRAPRRRTIRTQLVILLLVPLASLVALWGFAASLTLGPALTKNAVSRAYDKIGIPASTLSIQLQLERGNSVMYIASAHRDGGALAAQRAKTDRALAAFRRTALNAKLSGPSDKLVKQRTGELVDQLGRLGTLRGGVDRGSLPRLDIIDRYGSMVGRANELFSSLSLVNDLGVYQSARALNSLSWAVEFMQRESTLAGAAALGGGQLSVPERSALGQWVGAGRQYFDTGLAELTGKMRVPVQQVADSQDYVRFRQLETSLLEARGRPAAQTAGALGQLAPRLLQTLGQAVIRSGTILTGQAKSIGNQIMVKLVVAGGVGLLAVIASVLLSALFGRRLVRELRDLQRAARMLAEERLPRLVGLLRRGEPVDLNAEAPPISAARTTEIGRVADAFTQAQRVAVQSAVGESKLRQGISRVFLNLAWRSQSLLHRQLRMLDGMERRVTDPEALQDLFRLDHLTTRMRRHAEGLVILSGAPPGREWSKPARMEDVVRAAIAEVEDYERVEVRTAEPTALTGAVVADVVHMLAELIENATAFSPPNTEVLVRGETVGNGFAIEIIDRGIGMNESERARLNELLASPPEFDLADTDRLGLFVVSRLAARHGIKVRLQESGYSGTTAIVVLPRSLVVGALQSPAERPRPVPAAERAQPVIPWQDEPASPYGTSTVARAEPLYPNGGSAVPSAEHEPPAEHGPPADPNGPRPPLTRRRKMANLAPQLRDVRAGAEGVPAPGQQEGPNDTGANGGGLGHSADASRDLWSSLQGGWSRGREDNGEDM